MWNGTVDCRNWLWDVVAHRCCISGCAKKQWVVIGNFPRRRPLHLGNSIIRSTDPENPTLKPNMKWIGWSIAQIRPGSWHGSRLGRHRKFPKMLKGDQSPPGGFWNWIPWIIQKLDQNHQEKTCYDISRLSAGLYMCKYYVVLVTVLLSRTGLTPRGQGQGLRGPRTRTCKLVLKDPRGQWLSSWTITLNGNRLKRHVEILVD